MIISCYTMRGLAASSAIATMLAVVPSIAQQSDMARASAADTDIEVAQLYKDGVAAVKREDWAKAYEVFLRAWRLKRQYQIGAQLARAEFKLGKHRDAAEHLSYLLREIKHLEPGDRALLEGMLDEARSHVAAVRIAVDREGAEVLIDGAAVGVSPLTREFYLDPGRHSIEARVQDQG